MPASPSSGSTTRASGSRSRTRVAWCWRPISATTAPTACSSTCACRDRADLYLMSGFVGKEWQAVLDGGHPDEAQAPRPLVPLPIGEVAAVEIYARDKSYRFERDPVGRGSCTGTRRATIRTRPIAPIRLRASASPRRWPRSAGPGSSAASPTVRAATPTAWSIRRRSSSCSPTTRRGRRSTLRLATCADGLGRYLQMPDHTEIVAVPDDQITGLIDFAAELEPEPLSRNQRPIGLAPVSGGRAPRRSGLQLSTRSWRHRERRSGPTNLGGSGVSSRAPGLAHKTALHPAHVGARRRGRRAAVPRLHRPRGPGVWQLNAAAAAMRTRYGPGVSIPTTDGAEIESLGNRGPRPASWAAERALHDRSLDQRSLRGHGEQAPVPVGHLEHGRSHPVPDVRHHAEPASPGQWWRHGHHPVVRRNRERCDLVDARRDMATRAPRAVRGRLLTCLQHGGG